MQYKILLVDDDANILSAYRRLLRRQYDLVTAPGGFEGIEALKTKGPFAVVISDFRMPGMNGLEFLREAQEFAPETIRIILTGQADMAVAINAINEGNIYRFLTKPCPLPKFSKVLDSAIEQYRLVTVDRELKEKQQQLDLLQKTVEGIMHIVMSMVEKRDPYTAGHQLRVGEIAVAIAGEMNLAEEQINQIKMAATIHDIGKICIPAEILSKSGTISGAEYNLIKTHVDVGYEILRDITFPGPIATIVFQHHERMDGSGYPSGLTGEQILLAARIIAVADVVDAMASYRPYRPAFSTNEVLAEIRKNRGILYDTRVVNACLELFETKGFKPSSFRD